MSHYPPAGTGNDVTPRIIPPTHTNRLHLGCTSAAPRLHLGCTSGCISAALRLHPCSASSVLLPRPAARPRGGPRHERRRARRQPGALPEDNTSHGRRDRRAAADSREVAGDLRERYREICERGSGGARCLPRNRTGADGVQGARSQPQPGAATCRRLPVRRAGAFPEPSSRSVVRRCRTPTPPSTRSPAPSRSTI